MEDETKLGIVRTKAPIKKIGDSFYILLDKSTRAHLHVEEGIYLGAKLWNIEVETIICPKCKFEFEDEKDADPHDCPNCGSEFLDIDKGESKK